MTIEIAEQRQLVIDLRTGQTRPALPQAPVLSSSRAAWDGILLEQHAGMALETNDIVLPQHGVFLQLGVTAAYELKFGSDRVRTVRVQPGHIGILPAMTPVSARTLNTGDFLAVTLEPKFLLCSAPELMDPAGFELRVRTSHDDPLLRACLLALQREAESGGPGGRLYAESVATTVAAHLVRHHSRHKGELPSSGRGLPRHLFGRAIEYIQAHLGEDISLLSLADAVGLSPFYFSRLFKESTGVTPHQYLIQCRVHRAKSLLLVTSMSISQVALQVGFCDQSHLSAHFKRVYGLTPREFIRRSGGKRLAAVCNDTYQPERLNSSDSAY